MATHDHLIVVTGGPGAGKTTLLTALAARGFRSVPEAGRAIIRQQQAVGGAGLPWADPGLFAELMLAWDMRSYEAVADSASPVFFDRGIPDVIGYLRVSGRPVPPHMQRAAERYRYRRRVLVCPPWREIYVNDAERKQDFAEAERTYDAIAQTYLGLGYELAEVPKTDLAARIQFVYRTLGLARE